MAPRWGSVPLRIAGTLACTVLLSSCFGDPAPDPATAPLEVVLDSCALNRDEVAPGTHEVSIVGAGQLLVTDESNTEVLTTSSDGHGTGQLVATEQVYTFTCIADGGESETSLTVSPRR